MKRASYRAAIAWIAENDSSGDHDALEPDVVSSYVSSVLVADLFDVDSERVGRDVVAYRKRHHAEPQPAKPRGISQLSPCYCETCVARNGGFPSPDGHVEA